MNRGMFWHLISILAILGGLALLAWGSTQAWGGQKIAEPQSCSERITNGDFEGTGGWVEYSKAGASLISRFPPPSGSYHSGEWGAYLGDYNNAYDYIAQTVDIPFTATRVTLRYWWQIESDEDPASPGDFLTVTVKSGVGMSATVVDALASADASNEWREHTIDLSSYRGQRITLRFEVRTDEALPSAFFLDDVSVEACTGSTPTPTTTLPAPTSTPPSTATPTLTPTPVPTSTPTLPPTPSRRMYVPLTTQRWWFSR